MYRYLCIIVSLVVFAACEKEIELPYRSVEPLYVIEGRVTNEGTEVMITRTRDMDVWHPGWGLDGIDVSVITDDGREEILEYSSDGVYRPASDLTGEPGRAYTLKVNVDGEEYVSSSVMHPQVEIHDMYFRWMPILTERILFCTVEFGDIAGEENYYCYRMLTNGENYRWDVLTDRGKEGETITVDIVCMTERMAQENKEKYRDDILFEGDLIEIEIQSIDRRTFDYLYSLAISEMTSANPIDNFTGGCLGYFAAYSTSRVDAIFDYDQIP